MLDIMAMLIKTLAIAFYWFGSCRQANTHYQAKSMQLREQRK